MRLAKRLIFVGLGRQRVEPAGDIALLDRLLQALANVAGRARDRIDLEHLGRVRIAVGQRFGIFERRLGKDRAIVAVGVLQE